MSKIVKGVGDMLGFGASDAARDATNAQVDANNASIGLQRETRDIMRQDLAPYANFGKSALPALGGLLSTQGQYDFLQSSPMFQAAVRNSNNMSAAMGAANGRANSGGMVNELFQNYLATGENYLNNQFNRLMGATNIGQASAAGQANASGQAANQISQMYGNIGNAQAAGSMAVDNARQSVGGKLLGGGMGAALGGGLLGGAGLAGGGAMGAGLGALMGLSDRSFKKNIVKVGSDHISDIYEFEYIWGGGKYLGRMADEIAKTRPDAVRVVDGVQMVTHEFAPKRAA